MQVLEKDLSSCVANLPPGVLKTVSDMADWLSAEYRLSAALLGTCNGGDDTVFYSGPMHSAFLEHGTPRARKGRSGTQLPTLRYLFWWMANMPAT